MQLSFAFSRFRLIVRKRMLRRQRKFLVNISVADGAGCSARVDSCAYGCAYGSESLLNVSLSHKRGKAPAGFAYLMLFRKQAKNNQCGCLGVGGLVAFQPSDIVSWIRDFHYLCDFRVNAVAGKWIFQNFCCHAKNWVGLQERTESTHKNENMLFQKDKSLAAFAEDCSAAGSTRPSLLRSLANRPLRIGPKFLGYLCCSASQTERNRPLNDLHHPGQLHCSDVASNGQLFVGLLRRCCHGVEIVEL